MCVERRVVFEARKSSFKESERAARRERIKKILLKNIMRVFKSDLYDMLKYKIFNEKYNIKLYARKN